MDFGTHIANILKARSVNTNGYPLKTFGKQLGVLISKEEVFEKLHVAYNSGLVKGGTYV
jgi:hypothetical protein